MGGVATTAKYVVYASIEIDGIVDKPDVIGAIFGQTEGLLGSELDLRELQKSGRIGRIQVELERRNGRTLGKIVIPSSLDRVETVLIAAALETIDKVGPYNAKVRTENIEDLRAKKRKWIIDRAKELLIKWEREDMPETRKIVEEVLKAVRAVEVIKYGPEGLPAGPDVDKSNELIIVEGRADVINLVKHGYRNVIALGGATRIPKTIINLAKNKITTAFVDGDRGGELVLRELLQTADIDYVARAPNGKEVEDLTGKEIAKCLKNRMSAQEYLTMIERGKGRAVSRHEIFMQLPKELLAEVNNLRGTLEALIIDDGWNVIQRVPVRDLVDTVRKLDRAYAIVFDGIITQRLVDVAAEKGVRYLVGVRVGALSKIPTNIAILTFGDLSRER